MQEFNRIVTRCRDDIPSPFLVHRKPTRRVRSDWREHWTQVAPEMITRAFEEARDKSGCCNHMEKRIRPGFHEIRSLGGDQHRKSGWEEKRIQALYAHSEREMTEHYLSGHEHYVEISD